MDMQTDSPPPLFTKRETYALAVLTLSFIVASALVHVAIGSVGSSFLPHFRPAAAAPIQPIVIDHLLRATPTPTPAPTPRVVATAVPHEQRTNAPQARPPVHPPRPFSDAKPQSPAPFSAALPTGPPVLPTATSQPTASPVASPAAPLAPEVISDSDFVNKVTPDYPEIAKDENIEGTVTVRITIGPDGRVEAEVLVQSSGSAVLDDAALKAARNSEFRPPLVDGKPTSRDYLIVYTFNIDA